GRVPEEVGGVEGGREHRDGRDRPTRLHRLGGDERKGVRPRGEPEGVRRYGERVRRLRGRCEGESRREEEGEQDEGTPPLPIPLPPWPPRSHQTRSGNRP